MEYPKINSLWKRDDKHRFIMGNYSCPEFEAIKYWNVEEKIDGMNIRVYIKDGKIEVKGRTNDAMLPPKLLEFFHRPEFMDRLSYFQGKQAILFGEGFGGKIQKGGIYRKDISFILFDVHTGRWGTREEVWDVAEQLGLEYPEYLGLMTQEKIIEYVQRNPIGKYNDSGYTMEGVMCRSDPLMLFNRTGHPIMWKLKVRDFQL